MNFVPKSRRFRRAATAAILACSAVTLSAKAQAPAAATPAAAVSAGPLVGDPKRGLTKAATCIGCHAIPGYKADFPIVYSVPMIGGQNAQYIQNALMEYRKGERRFPSMRATAQSLSDQDMADLAAYFSSQR